MLLPGGDWEPVNAGESATEVFRRGSVYAKVCGPAGVAELLAERDRIEWLSGTPIPGARVLDWIEDPEGAEDAAGASRSAGAALLTSAVPGVAAVDLPWSEKLVASFGAALRAVHSLPVESCPFERSLAATVVQAADLVVCHGDACLPNFLFDPDTLEWTGAIDVGRLGVADRYADLALVRAQLADEWSVDASGFFVTYGLAEPDPQRLDFYLLLDPLTWG